MCPVVLNPYRDNAIIDMGNEANLTAQRLTALLICEDDAMKLIPDYELDGIVFTFNDSFMHNFKYVREGMPREKLIDDFIFCAMDPNSYARQILRVMDCNINNGQPRILTVLAMYIVQKVLNIAETYPVYTDLYLKVRWC